MLFGSSTDEKDSIAIVERALNAGINFIDTANVYNEGLSEEIVGKALAKSGKRDKTVLATKFWGVMGSDPNDRGTSRRHVIEQCDASLRRLGVDHIDLYQIHRPASDVPIDETLRALDDLIRAGKVRYIGTSTFASWQIMESLWVSKELGLNRVVTEQPPYHLLDRRIEREVVPMAETYGIGLLPWSPLAQGFLSGKYRRGDTPPEGSRFEDPQVGEVWEKFRFTEGNPGVYTDAAYDILDVVEALAGEKGRHPHRSPWPGLPGSRPWRVSSSAPALWSSSMTISRSRGRDHRGRLRAARRRRAARPCDAALLDPGLRAPRAPLVTRRIDDSSSWR